MSLRRQLRANRAWILAIALLAVAASASLAYILANQHLTFPWQDRYRVYAEFSAVNGLEPGLGQPVNVAGVRVGTIRGTTLRDGHAVAELEIDPGKLPRLYRDARAQLIPTTALKDLRVDLVPGSPRAGALPEGARIAVARTTSPIDADDLLSALDGDTREFLRVLIAEGDRATDGRASDLRALLKAMGPTAEQLRGVTQHLARRHHSVERLVTNLAQLSRAVGSRDRELATLIARSSEVVGELSDQHDALDRSLVQLPATLRAVRGTLVRAMPFSRQARAALTALQPSVERLPRTLDATAPLARASGPIIGHKLRPLARDAQPAAADLRAAVPRLDALAPHLTNVARVLVHATNELGYNPPGKDEGFLHHIAWALHNTNSILTSADANGPVVRSLVLVACDAVLRDPALAPLADLLFGTLPSCPERR